MRNLIALDGYRDLPAEFGLAGFIGDRNGGIFKLTSNIDRASMRVIASAAHGWDHVSVSRPDRTPAWEEMEQVRHLFFEPHAVVMQLHVPATDHINNHPHCLHLWRPHYCDIPRPPGELVGISGLSPEDVRDLSDDAKERLRAEVLGKLESGV